MVAAVGAELFRVLDLGRAAELAHPDDQGLVQQAPRIEVPDQRRNGLVGDRQQPILELVEIVAVSVPATVSFSADRGGIVDRHETNAGLYQAVRQQAALAIARASVLVAKPVCFFRQIERTLDLRRAQHRHRRRVEGVDPTRGLGPAREIRLAVDQLLQAPSIFEPPAATTRAGSAREAGSPKNSGRGR